MKSYFEWLESFVGGDAPDFRYHHLLHKMYTKVFRSVVEEDIDRVIDATVLQVRYEDVYGACPVERVTSVLEVLIALSERMCFAMDEDPENAGSWFWEMVKNLGLDGFTDDIYDEIWNEAYCILDRFVERKYEKDGKGGIFPLLNSDTDQTVTPLWYQMHAYLLERYDF